MLYYNVEITFGKVKFSIPDPKQKKEPKLNYDELKGLIRLAQGFNQNSVEHKQVLVKITNTTLKV